MLSNIKFGNFVNNNEATSSLSEKG
jgi:hypothetical protein